MGNECHEKRPIAGGEEAEIGGNQFNFQCLAKYEKKNSFTAQ